MLDSFKKSTAAQPLHWHRLDNTANLFPVISTRGGSNVFRLTAVLTQPVDPTLLQQALERTLPWFSAFRVRMRRGLFWYYLDENLATPRVQPEDDYPCRPIDPKDNNRFLFRLSYHQNKINLEVFHALSDGTGAMSFLQAICCQYLILAHPQAFTAEQKARRWFAEHGGNIEDGYAESYVPTKKSTFDEKRGYRLKGERNLIGNLGVIHAIIPLQELLTFCRGKGISLSQYLMTVLAWSLYTQPLNGRAPKHPVNIVMPVNLRQMFESNTTLNFFSNAYISYDYANSPTFDELLEETQKQFKEKVTRQAMLERISYTVGSGYNIFARVVPLFIKNTVLRFLYAQGAKAATMGFSNVGAVRFPAPFEPFVKSAAVLLSTNRREPLKCSALSYGDYLTVTFTSTLKSTAIQRAFVRKLTEDGLSVTIETNGVDYENL